MRKQLSKLGVTGAIIAGAVISGAVVAQTSRPENKPLAETSFTLDAPAEAIATVRATCAGCDWSATGREGAAISIAVDGRYRSNVMLTQGNLESDARVLL